MAAPQGPQQMYSDEQRAKFRGYVTPELWQQMGAYRAGEPQAQFPSYRDIFGGQYVPEEDENFLRDFLAQLLSQQTGVRSDRLPGKKKQSPTGDPLLDDAREQSGR